MQHPRHALLLYLLPLPALGALVGGTLFGLYGHLAGSERLALVGLASYGLAFALGTWLRLGARSSPGDPRAAFRARYARSVGTLIQAAAVLAGLLPWEFELWLPLDGCTCGDRSPLPLPLHLAGLLVITGLLWVGLWSRTRWLVRVLAFAVAAVVATASCAVLSEPCHVGQPTVVYSTLCPELGRLRVDGRPWVRAMFGR